MSGPTSTPKVPTPSRNGPPPPGPGQGAGRIRIPRWLSIAILVGLLLWNAYLLLAPTAVPSVDVPYSTFLDQARADNVATITLSGQAVTGTFRTAIQYSAPRPSSVPISGSPRPRSSLTMAVMRSSPPC